MQAALLKPQRLSGMTNLILMGHTTTRCIQDTGRTKTAQATITLRHRRTRKQVWMSYLITSQMDQTLATMMKANGENMKSSDFTPHRVGVAAEAIAAAQFARLGYDVSVQYGANQHRFCPLDA